MLGRLPIDPALALACDAGAIEEALPQDFLPEATSVCEAIPAHEGAPEDTASQGDAEA